MASGPNVEIFRTCPNPASQTFRLFDLEGEEGHDLVRVAASG